ncbi:hypothetical protein V2I01_29325 [Micromonospora sp. BRA006-A]|nr:hypothetical protein [Micromonospora sp. BRA006-A]
MAGQSALNGRVAASVGPAAGLAVNFAVSTVVIGAVAALTGALASQPRWPAPVVALPRRRARRRHRARAAGRGTRRRGLRTGLALVAGQLGGALLLDLVLPGGPGVRLPVLAGARSRCSPWWSPARAGAAGPCGGRRRA